MEIYEWMVFAQKMAVWLKWSWCRNERVCQGLKCKVLRVASFSIIPPPRRRVNTPPDVEDRCASVERDLGRLSSRNLYWDNLPRNPAVAPPSGPVAEGSVPPTNGHCAPTERQWFRISDYTSSVSLVSQGTEPVCPIMSLLQHFQ